MSKLPAHTRLKLFVLFMMLLSSAAPAQQPIDTPHNIQILVEMKQAAFQSQGIETVTSQSTQKQFIVVSEGMEGKIFIGERVSYATYFQYFLTKEGYLVGQPAGFTFQDVGTSLIVSARVLGDQIEVTLTPEISYVTANDRRSIAVQKMSTSVRVPAGQTFEIGGNLSRSEFESNFYRGASGQALQVLLTPKILG